MAEPKFVSVVAYVKNSEEQIAPFLDAVMQTVEREFERCELILVDDASQDHSVEKVHAYYDAHQADYLVSIIRMGAAQGLESSMNAGRDMAIGDYVYEFDDMVVDYDLSLIRQVYDRCVSGADIVSAVSGVRTRMTSRMFYSVFNRFSKTQNRIGQETFRIVSRRAVNRVRSIGSYIPYRKAVYQNCGLKTASIRYQSTDKTGRTIHSHNDERADLAVDSFIYFTNVMEKTALVISSVFLVITILVIVYVIVSFFTDSHLVSGWISLMGFLSLGFLGIFSLLTIVMKYLSVIVNLTFRHQHYLVESIEKISRN